MSKTPEGKVKAAVKALLALPQYAENIWTNWPVPGGYGTPMLDCIGSYKGRAFAIETKHNDTLTPRQEFTRSEMERGGVVVFVIGERVTQVGNKATYSGMDDLKGWLDSL